MDQSADFAKGGPHAIGFCMPSVTSMTVIGCSWTPGVPASVERRTDPQPPPAIAEPGDFAWTALFRPCRAGFIGTGRGSSQRRAFRPAHG